MKKNLEIWLHGRPYSLKNDRDMMGWVLKVFLSRKRSLLLTLLKSFVIPLLEYCCLLWNRGKQKTYKQSKQFNERLHTKSLKHNTKTTMKDCTNSNYTLFTVAVNVI